jgi:diguanylate cyclase (GGDEF)-like protein
LWRGKTAEQVHEVVDATRVAIADARLTLRGPSRPKKKSKKVTKARRPTKQGGIQVSVSASFGLASGDTRGAPSAAVVERADKALYKAKKAGRNRVMMG